MVGQAWLSSFREMREALLHGFHLEGDTLRGHIEVFFESPSILTSMRERAKAMKMNQIKSDVKDRGFGLTNKNARMLLAEIQRLQSTIDSSPEKLFYIQCSDNTVGNEALWWRPDGHGYTTHLSEAGKYTAAESTSIHRIRKSDVPWLCSEVEDLAYWTVDVGDLRKLVP